MLIIKEVEVKWHVRNKEWYESKGYSFTKLGDTFIIKTNDLIRGNYTIKVDVLCDYCLEDGKETICSKVWKDYVRSRLDVEKDCCTQCQAKKVKDVLMKKYNVENIYEVPGIKEKRKNTMIEHYGVEHLFQSPLYLKKVRQTMKDRYGFESAMQNPEIVKKVQATNIIRYGFVSPMQNEEVKLKQRNTAYKNGTIISSRQQRYINDIYNGKLNYVIDRISVDIGFVEEKVYVEYDGSGHRLPIKLNKINEKDFLEKEKRRSFFLIKSGWKEIRIISAKDLLPSSEMLLEILEYAKRLFNEEDFHRVVFDIDNNNVTTSKWTKEYNYGELKFVKNLDAK